MKLLITPLKFQSKASYLCHCRILTLYTNSSCLYTMHSISGKKKVNCQKLSISPFHRERICSPTLCSPSLEGTVLFDHGSLKTKLCSNKHGVILIWKQPTAPTASLGKRAQNPHGDPAENMQRLGSIIRFQTEFTRHERWEKMNSGKLRQVSVRKQRTRQSAAHRLQEFISIYTG